MVTRPNVLVIHTDEQRVDTLRLYGNEAVQTPTIDRLAARGTVFDRAFVPYPQCIPSRTAFMTGRYPHVTGSTANTRAGHASPDQRGLLLQDREQQHVPAVLQAAGYRIGLAGKNHCFNERMLAAFDFVRQSSHFGPATDWQPALAERWLAFVRGHGLYGGPVVGWAEAPFAPEECPGGLAATAALEFLAQRGDEPFFLWLSLPEPHLPFTVPAPWAQMYDPNDVTVPAWHEGELTNKPVRQQVTSRRLGMHKAPHERKLHELIALYWGMVSYVDDQIGRVLDDVERRGLVEDTIVVYSTDHGAFMGEHQLMHKSNAFYDCLMRTPLVVSWPGGLDGPDRTETLVSTVDVMPTILDLVGLETPSVVQGQSFAPLLRGEPYDERQAVFGEAGILAEPPGWDDVAGSLLPPDPFAPRDQWQGSGNRVMRAWDGRAKMIRTAEWKYNHYLNNGERELYDLRADPGELVNRAGDPALLEIESELRTQLLDWCIATEDTIYGR